MEDFTEDHLSLAESWYEEKHREFFRMGYRVKDILFSGKSEYQSVDIIETYGHGRMLLNDGLVMISERDEFVYHDMIAHVPLFVHPSPKRVLIVGGGDGGTAREVLRHKSVEKCVMVEIDAMVVESCKEYILQTACSLEDPRLELKIEDAVKYMAETTEKFDVILVDSTDPIGPAQPLFGEEFYSNINKCLEENGVVVSQGGSPFYDVEVQQSMLKILGQHFPVATIYSFSNLTYPGGRWSFTFGSKSLDPIKDFSAQRVKDSGLEFDYYNSQTHYAAFSQPEFVEKNLKGLIKDASHY